jgi:hypothetical protein
MNTIRLRIPRERGGCLERLADAFPVTRFLEFREMVSANTLAKYFRDYLRLKIERDCCASVRGGITVDSSETNAPGNGFSRQRASSRSRKHGYVLVLFSSLRKALGISAVPLLYRSQLTDLRWESVCLEG